MKKILPLLLLCSFLFPACSLIDCSGKKPDPKPDPKTASQCLITDTMPHTLAFFPAVTRIDTAAKIIENILIGGVANDSISVSNISYRSSSKTYNTNPFPALPKPLMNGFAFKLKDTIYYGGGYTVNWNNSYITPKDTIFSMKYISSTQGFVSSESGRIFSTTNSGANWNEKKLNSSSTLLSVDFSGTSTGWIVTDSSSSKIFKTTNTGGTWDNGTLIGNARIKSVKFTDVNTGWAAGSEGKIFKTINGGAVWDTVQRKSFENLNSVSFINQKFGWACGDGGRILKTTDGGTFWDTLKFTNNNLYSICFKDSATGYVVGANGTVGKSTNGGAAWTAVQVEATQTLRSVDIRNSDSVVACGDKGVVLYSNNGIKWERIYGVTPNDLNSICRIPGMNKTAIGGAHGFTSYANEGCFRYTVSNSFYKRHRFDNSSAWTSCANLPIPLSEVFCSGGALNDSTGYVVGGKTTGDAYSDKIYRYSTKTGKWTACTKLPYPRSYGGLAVVSDTMMLYLGGINSVNVTDTMYKITVKISSGQPDSLNIIFTAKYPAGPAYGEGSIGMKRRGLAIFTGGIDSIKTFYPYIVTFKFPYTTAVIDTCDQNKSFGDPPSPVDTYTINWTCPIPMNRPEPYLITNNSDRNDVQQVSFEYVQCMCAGITPEMILSSSREEMCVTGDALPGEESCSSGMKRLVRKLGIFGGEDMAYNSLRIVREFEY